MTDITAVPGLAPVGATTGDHVPRRRRRRMSPGRVVAWVVMVVLLIITLFPFYWMLRTALSSNSALYANATSWLPVDFSWGGFERVFGLQSTEEAIAQGGSGASIDFWRYLGNSVFVATGITVCQVFFSSMAAYAFARLRWKGDRKSTRLNSSHVAISYAVFCLKKKMRDEPLESVHDGHLIGQIVSLC